MSVYVGFGNRRNLAEVLKVSSKVLGKDCRFGWPPRVGKERKATKSKSERIIFLDVKEGQGEGTCGYLYSKLGMEVGH